MSPNRELYSSLSRSSIIKFYTEPSIRQKKKTDTTQEAPNIKMLLKLTKAKSKVLWSVTILQPPSLWSVVPSCNSTTTKLQFYNH